MTIRRAEPADAAALAALSNAIEAASFVTAQSFRPVLEHDWPSGTERLVAERDGEVVAFARCRVAPAGAWAWVGVLHAHRRQGIGSELYGRLEPVVARRGAMTIWAGTDDADGSAFAKHHGFALANTMRLQALDLTTVALPLAPLPVVSLREVDTWAIRDLYVETIAQIPSQTPRPRPTDDDFKRNVAESEIVDLDASVVALEEGEVVAFALVVANYETGRAGAQMTGVRADRRGRGLAQAVKLASLHRARAAGLHTMITVNDLENEPMLAINRKLGFEPSIVIEQFEKTL